MTLEAFLPSITLSGGNAPARQRILAQLRAHGYRATDDAQESLTGGLIDINCPAVSDADTMEALASAPGAMLARDRQPERTARLIVLPGHGDQARSALAAARGCHYVAIVQDSSSGEALARQVAYAARWLDMQPAAPYAPQSDVQYLLSQA